MAITGLPTPKFWWVLKLYNINQPPSAIYLQAQQRCFYIAGQRPWTKDWKLMQSKQQLEPDIKTIKKMNKLFQLRRNTRVVPYFTVCRQPSLVSVSSRFPLVAVSAFIHITKTNTFWEPWHNTKYNECLTYVDAGILCPSLYHENEGAGIAVTSQVSVSFEAFPMVILLSGGRPLVHLGVTKQTISGPQVLIEEQ